MKKIVTGLFMLSLFAACKKETIEDVTVKPSEGSKIQLEGIKDGEAGSAAGNAVFVDFSTDKATPVARASWDLAFYNGNEARVFINNMTGATAYVTDKTDINAVSIADTVGVKVSFDHTDPQVTDFNLIDAVNGDITKTVIPEVKATDNKVIIIDRGTGGGTPARDLVKVKVSKDGDSYKVEYGALNGTSVQTATIIKNADYNFQYLSFDNGSVNVEPKKAEWDIVWTTSMYEFNMGVLVPYIFSDLIITNYLNNVQVVEKTYATEAEASQAYTDYALSNTSSESFVNDRWAIGKGWRQTTMPGSTTKAGTIKTKFYVVKDANGNYYKLKFISFSEDDGGQRGRPEIQYALLK